MKLDVRKLCLMLADILEEYRLLEDTPLRAVKRVTTIDSGGEVELLNPYILLELDNGEQFKIQVIR